MEWAPEAAQDCALRRDGEAENHSSVLCRPALTYNCHVKCEVLLGSDFEGFGFRISLLFLLQRVIGEYIRWR